MSPPRLTVLAFRCGDRVRVMSLLFPEGGTATVTDPDNGLWLHSVTALYDGDGREWIFSPDELEVIADERPSESV